MSTEDYDIVLNLKCVPNGLFVGDGLDPWKILKNMNFESFTGYVMAYMYVQNHMQKT
jgi:hypothetical protein